MRKQKAKKSTTAPSVIITEQPEEYKKAVKEKKESYKTLRDITDAMKRFLHEILVVSFA